MKTLCRKYKISKSSVLLLQAGILALPLLAAAQSDLPEGLYNVEFSQQELNRIQELFPERGGINPSYIHSQTDPNLILLDDAEISVTFIDEGAGYRNSFGYFLYDSEGTVLYEETLFNNASKIGSGGSLRAGDTLDIGTFEAGSQIGFWLQAGGYDNPNGYTYYTIDSLNPDGLRHMAIASDETNERLVIGIEDLYGLGAEDYNAIIFTFSATPFSAIDRSNIPTGTPTPSAAAVSLIGLAVLYLKRRRRKSTLCVAGTPGNLTD